MIWLVANLRGCRLTLPNTKLQRLQKLSHDKQTAKTIYHVAMWVVIEELQVLIET